MKTVYFKNANGYIATYPNKAIYANGKRIPATVLVCGREPSTPNDPSTVAEAVINGSRLGVVVEPCDIPDEWRIPLGLIARPEPRPEPPARPEPRPEPPVRPRRRTVSLEFEVLPRIEGDPEEIANRILLVSAVMGWSVWLVAMFIRLFVCN